MSWERQQGQTMTKSYQQSLIGLLAAMRIVQSIASIFWANSSLPGHGTWYGGVQQKRAIKSVNLANKHILHRLMLRKDANSATSTRAGAAGTETSSFQTRFALRTAPRNGNGLFETARRDSVPTACRTALRSQTDSHLAWLHIDLACFPWGPFL